jgi:hypothetical protein
MKVMIIFWQNLIRIYICNFIYDMIQFNSFKAQLPKGLITYFSFSHQVLFGQKNVLNERYSYS